ncbi:uncharacterized protein LOC100233149 [Nasonia vitripennis]|uniref:Uncharacterized protein n=1 Tax=Nasonia vitripennis TaxID=7425 RepID=A0A7M6W8B6_NASVI|nr:uncharacterized protein LOC100233149 [Nasonia vitripennis]
MDKQTFNIMDKMNEIKHWWNSVNYLKKFDGEQANNARMYFVQRCREFSKTLELPNQNFGPSVMCSHCGSLWSKNESQIRILPGKNPSKSVKEIIKSCSEDNKISRFRATLMKKSLRNKMNKVVIKCSVCSKNTQISCTKPVRPKPKKEDNKEVANVRKKKKKKGKDKTAGLKISTMKTPDVTEKKQVEPVVSTPISINVKKPKGKQVTSVQKVRKINLNKLNNVLNDSKVQKSRSSFNNFLKELY